MLSQGVTQVRKFLLVIPLLPALALAEFKISYPADDDPSVKVKKPRDAVLLVNNSVSYVTEVGSGEAAEIVGNASNIPIAEALAMITPAGWKVYSAPDIEFDGVRTDLHSGESWTDALARTGQDNDLLFTVNWNHREIVVSRFREKGVFDAGSAPLSDTALAGVGSKVLHLSKGDLRESLAFFAQMNGLTLEYDVFANDRSIRVHPTVAEFTHPIPECITWTLPNNYDSRSAEWLEDLNRILIPYRLKTFLFSNNVLFLTSIHEYGSDFCKGRHNEI